MKNNCKYSSDFNFVRNKPIKIIIQVFKIYIERKTQVSNVFQFVKKQK